MSESDKPDKDAPEGTQKPAPAEEVEEIEVEIMDADELDVSSTPREENDKAASAAQSASENGMSEGNPLLKIRPTPPVLIICGLAVLGLAAILGSILINRGDVTATQTINKIQQSTEGQAPATTPTENTADSDEGGAGVVTLDLPVKELPEPKISKITNDTGMDAKGISTGFDVGEQSTQGTITELPVYDGGQIDNSGLDSLKASAKRALSEMSDVDGAAKENGVDHSKETSMPVTQTTPDAVDAGDGITDKGTSGDSTTGAGISGDKETTTPVSAKAGKNARDGKTNNGPDSNIDADDDYSTGAEPDTSEPFTQPDNTLITEQLSAAATQNAALREEVSALREMLERQASEFDQALATERANQNRQARQIIQLQNQFQNQLAVKLDETNSQIAALQAQIDREAERNQDRTAEKNAAAALALTSLIQQFERGAPFQVELATLESLAPTLPAINVLRPHAARGIATHAQLYDRFDKAARTALDAANSENADGILGGLRANLGKLVSIRPATFTDGDTPAAIISRAEDRLSHDNIDETISYLNELDGAAADAFIPWIQDAQARLDATNAINSLNNTLLSVLDQ